MLFIWYIKFPITVIWGSVWFLSFRVHPIIFMHVHRGHLTHAHNPVTVVSSGHHPVSRPLLWHLLHHSCAKSHLEKLREGHPTSTVWSPECPTVQQAWVGWGSGGRRVPCSLAPWAGSQGHMLLHPPPPLGLASSSPAIKAFLGGNELGAEKGMELGSSSS